MQNNSQQTYKDLPTALEALAADLDSGRFEQGLQSRDSLTLETPKAGQPEATKTYEVSFVPNKLKPSKLVVNETFETLWEYCTSNNRLCPTPMKWNDLFGMLKNTNQNPSGGSKPPLPLILAAWHDTTPLEKMLRFQKHIKWAFDNNQIEEIGKYLRSLPEEDWTHYEEI